MYVVKNGLCVIALIALIIVTAGVMAQNKNVSNVKVTFVELGSVNCVPCRMMQPVMDKVRKKYGAQVDVVFHDVWTDKGRKYGKMYRIRAIPTQVFLDAQGKEFFRHEGYFPFEEVEKILMRGGVH